MIHLKTSSHYFTKSLIVDIEKNYYTFNHDIYHLLLYQKFICAGSISYEKDFEHCKIFYMICEEHLLRLL